jgi:putative ABC transport system substrate-binding protein
MMDRRTFVGTATGALLVKALPANAQSAKKVPRIGVLHAGPQATASQFVAPFTQGLREHGYVEGQSIVVEHRFADNKAERITEIAAELVRLKVDVIVTNADVAIAAVKQQTQTIPIVMATSTDPSGQALSRASGAPGGNIPASPASRRAQRQAAGTAEGSRPWALPSGDHVESRRPGRRA